MNEETAARTVRATVGKLDDLPESSMKVVEVGEHRIALIRTSSGVHALDNACPHQGYGLVTGALGSDTVTCQWHNWKFDVATGRCLLGEEDVPCHRVTIDDGTIEVEVTEPTDAELQARLWPSLRRGLEADYMGQAARDTLRLLDAGATPAEIMAQAVALTLPKVDYGLGHELAMAADCLAVAEMKAGDERLLPLVQGLSGLSEATRDRPSTRLPTPDATITFTNAVETENVHGAMASVLGQLEAGVEPDGLRHQFLDAASAHHIGYGHGIIYTQKSFEILDRLGWEHAPSVLPHLAESLVYGTREDTLPYMRKAMRAISAVDLEALAAAPDRRRTGWSDPGLVGSFLAASEAPIDAAVAAVHAGAGVEGLLDTVSQAVSLRLLAHDLDVEFDTGEPFGWLSITHGLTTAEASRWAWRADPGPHTARLALFATWLMFDTGRLERRRRIDPPLTSPEAALDTYGSTDGGIGTAVLDRRATDAVAAAFGSEPEQAAASLADAALNDRAGSFIVTAHLIKMAEAARRESAVVGSTLPLAATARFLAAPRLERFVAGNVAASIDFIRSGRPPRR